MAQPSRLPGLDLLRAAAIGWVMVCHAASFGFLPSDYFGWMGVDLFFALSGFLIGGQLFRPLARGETPAYGAFFARRLLRTLPAYWVVLAIYFAFPVLWDRAGLQPAWQFLTFTQNLLIDPQHANSLSQAWSLCVEEQFYLVLPAVVLLLGGRAGPKTVVGVILALLGGGMVLRGWLWLTQVRLGLTQVAPGGDWPDASVWAYMRYIYYPSWTRLDPLLAGVVAALIRTFRPNVWKIVGARPNLILALGVVGVGLSIVFFGDEVTTFWPATLCYPLLAVSMAALVAAGSEASSIIGRVSIPGAAPLAAASYSLYLTHKLAYHAVIRLTEHGPPWLQTATPALAVLAALLVGGALYLLVERPFLKLRDRFRRAPAPAAAIVVAE